MRRRRILATALAMGLLAAGALTLAQPAVAAAGTEAPSRKRGPPPNPKPVTVRGVRYEAVNWRRRELPDPGGYVSAVGRDGRELWLVKVYEIRRDPDLEEDKQDVFIARLKATDGGRALLVTTERGDRYRLDLTTRAVTRP